MQEANKTVNNLGPHHKLKYYMDSSSRGIAVRPGYIQTLYFAKL